MPNILDQIMQQATSGANSGAAVFNTPAGFDGTRQRPSDGFTLPVAPATKSLYSYQLAAVETILTYKRVVLGLQPGMGKTAVLQAVAASEAQQGRRTICIVPPSLRISPWAQEFAADYPHLKVYLVEGQKASAIPHDADVVIVGDSVITHRLADLQAFGAVNVFIDEAHRMKSRTAKRSKAAQTLCDGLPADGIVVAATGTLAAKNAGDVYQPVRIAGEQVAKAVSGSASWTAFMNAWCETQLVWTGRANVQVVTGCSDPEGLRDRLVSTCMVSVPRDEVLDLPERTFPVRQLVLNGDAAEYRRAERDFMAWVAAKHGDAAARRAAKAEAITKLNKLIELDGAAKVKATCEYVQALVEQGEQVVVIAVNQVAIKGLKKALSAQGIDSLVFDGGVSSEDKAAAVDAFQAGQVPVIIGQVRAAGVGITLHAAAHLVHMQLPWSPADFGQASDRIYRIGQTRHVSIHVLNGLGMISERIWDVLQGRAQVCDAINTGKPSTIDGDEVVDQVLAGYGW